MKPTHVTALALTLLTYQHAAGAGDWSYCVAPADAESRIYISLPFPALGAIAESDFAAMLDRRRLPHDTVECARADDEAAAVVMRQHAIEANRQWGREVIDTHWRPAP